MQRDKDAENQHKHKTKRQNPKHKQNPKKASSNQKCIGSGTNFTQQVAETRNKNII